MPTLRIDIVEPSTVWIVGVWRAELIWEKSEEECVMWLQQIESRSQKEDLPRSIERANEDDASRSNQSLSDDIL